MCCLRCVINDNKYPGPGLYAGPGFCQYSSLFICSFRQNQRHPVCISKSKHFLFSEAKILFASTKYHNIINFIFSHENIMIFIMIYIVDIHSHIFVQTLAVYSNIYSNVYLFLETSEWHTGLSKKTDTLYLYALISSNIDRCSNLFELIFTVRISRTFTGWANKK